MLPARVAADMSTLPAGPAGNVAKTRVGETTSTAVAETPPNSTDVVPPKFDPVIETCIPPVVGPLLGDTEEITGVGSETILITSLKESAM